MVFVAASEAQSELLGRLGYNGLDELADDALDGGRDACRRQQFLHPESIDYAGGIVTGDCLAQVDVSDDEAIVSCAGNACPGGLGCSWAAELLSSSVKHIEDA
jgi:hypothetical protein